MHRGIAPILYLLVAAAIVGATMVAYDYYLAEDKAVEKGKQTATPFKQPSAGDVGISPPSGQPDAGEIPPATEGCLKLIESDTLKKESDGAYMLLADINVRDARWYSATFDVTTDCDGTTVDFTELQPSLKAGMTIGDVVSSDWRLAKDGIARITITNSAPDVRDMLAGNAIVFNIWRRGTPEKYAIRLKPELRIAMPLNAIGFVRDKVREDGDWRIYGFDIVGWRLDSGDRTYYWSPGNPSIVKHVSLALPNAMGIESLYQTGNQFGSDEYYEVTSKSTESMPLTGALYYGSEINRVIFFKCSDASIISKSFCPKVGHGAKQSSAINVGELSVKTKFATSWKESNVIGLEKIIDPFITKYLAEDKQYMFESKASEPDVLASGRINVAVPIFYSGKMPPADIKIFQGDGALTKSFPAESKLSYADTWFGREALRVIGRKMVSIDITYFGPYETEPIAASGARDEAAIRKLLGYFNSKIGKESESFPIVYLVYLSDKDYPSFRLRTPETSSAVVFSSYPTIAGCNDCLKTHNLDECSAKKSCPSSIEYKLKIKEFIHEVMHAFGASDQYKGKTCKETDDPSETHDMMCGTILDDKGFPSLQNINIPSRAIISDLAQKEIGWIDLDGDGIPEAESTCPFYAFNC